VVVGLVVFRERKEKEEEEKERGRKGRGKVGQWWPAVAR